LTTKIKSLILSENQKEGEIALLSREWRKRQILRIKGVIEGKGDDIESAGRFSALG